MSAYVPLMVQCFNRISHVKDSSRARSEDEVEPIAGRNLKKQSSTEAMYWDRGCDAFYVPSMARTRRSGEACVVWRSAGKMSRVWRPKTSCVDAQAVLSYVLSSPAQETDPAVSPGAARPARPESPGRSDPRDQVWSTMLVLIIWTLHGNGIGGHWPSIT